MLALSAMPFRNVLLRLARPLKIVGTVAGALVALGLFLTWGHTDQLRYSSACGRFQRCHLTWWDLVERCEPWSERDIPENEPLGPLAPVSKCKEDWQTVYFEFGNLMMVGSGGPSRGAEPILPLYRTYCVLKRGGREGGDLDDLAPRYFRRSCGGEQNRDGPRFAIVIGSNDGDCWSVDWQGQLRHLARAARRVAP